MFGDYWLGLWASKEPEEQQKVRLRGWGRGPRVWRGGCGLLCSRADGSLHASLPSPHSFHGLSCTPRLGGCRGCTRQPAAARPAAPFEARLIAARCLLLPPIPTSLQLYWVWGYAIMVGSILLISFARSYLFYMAALRAASRLHAEVAERVSAGGRAAAVLSLLAAAAAAGAC